METDSIEQDFRAKVSSEVRLMPEGLARFRLSTPFMFDDGDHLVMYLKQVAGQWLLTDEGHTFMHLTYDMNEEDLGRGTRAEIIGNTLEEFSVEDREGVLVVPVPDAQYGDALFSFVQAILRISDVSYLARERVVSTFLEDLREFLYSVIPEERITADWHHPVKDPTKLQVADYRINGVERPLCVFALPTAEKTSQATIAVLTFKSWHMPFRSLGIYEDVEKIPAKVVARFMRVCDRPFPSLSEPDRDLIIEHLHDVVGLS